MLRMENDMCRQSVKTKSAGQPVAAPAIVVSLALALGGCSADFLRFDAPAFNLNGDKSSVERVADTSSGNSLYDQNQNSPPQNVRPYASAQTESISGDSLPPTTYQAQQRRQVASAAPVRPTAAPKTKNDPYSQVKTGALPGASSRITVRPGDTLYQLSRRHGVSVAALRQANSLTGNVIKPGQTLVVPAAGARNVAAAPRNTAPNAIRYRPTSAAPRSPVAPGGQSYTVRPGDSLYAISRRTHVSVAELKRLNGITDVRALRPGTQLALGGNSQAPHKSERQAPARVASHVQSSSAIKAKPIKTLPIVRTSAPTTPISAPPVSAPVQPSAPAISQPRILNQRPSTPIATKPEIKVATAPQAGEPAKFRWPARGRVIAEFNHTGKGVKNDGINIALPVGSAIGAADDGVVAYAGSELKGYGNLVLVRHDNGWVSAYAHASEILVKRGDRITRGQTIAKAGRSGGVSQPQLHFELRQGAKPVDPMPHMAQM